VQRWLNNTHHKTNFLVADDCDCGERFEEEASAKRAQVVDYE
jgi:hypothetical protein